MSPSAGAGKASQGPAPSPHRRPGTAASTHPSAPTPGVTPPRGGLFSSRTPPAAQNRTSGTSFHWRKTKASSPLDRPVVAASAGWRQGHPHAEMSTLVSIGAPSAEAFREQSCGPTALTPPQLWGNLEEVRESGSERCVKARRDLVLEEACVRRVGSGRPHRRPRQLWTPVGTEAALFSHFTLSCPLRLMGSAFTPT